ncbi:uncharacterized protein [Rutidosis leptorrhynchoides]|uniref:uncharacterized protein n=1 Tax=Rutidosis leptorrhynchoides TaxID=125765 RepID=UPI003A99FC02
MNWLSLNIGGGMFSKDKQNWVRKLCNENSISVLGLQETKMISLNYFAVKAFWGNFHFKVASSCARGRSGGIVTLLDPRFFTSSRVISFDNLLIVQGSFVNSSSVFYLINVYAPQPLHLKKHLWLFINNFMTSNGGDYIFFGDFNSVRTPSERMGTNFCQRTADAFNDFIITGNLVDIPLGGRAYTRVNKAFTKRAKLDIFLVSNGFLCAFPHLTGTIISNLWSDHCPILLRNKMLDYGPSPFRLFKSWFEFDGFEDTVINTWNDVNTYLSSNPHIRLKDKLKRVKIALKAWHSDIRTKAIFDKKTLLNQLDDIDSQLNASVNPTNLVVLRSTILKDLAFLESVESANLAQKNKKLAICLGDENSSFFHTSLNRKRRKDQINGIMHNGNWETSPLLVKKVFVDFFF